MPRHTQAEEVEQGDTYSDSEPGPHDGRSADHLGPSAGEVEERGLGGDRGDGENGEEKEDRDGAEETFIAYRDQGGDRVASYN